MPLTYRIDKSLGMIFGTATGVVTLDEIRPAVRDLLVDPGFEPTFGELMDLREVTELRLAHDDIRRFVGFAPLSGGGRRAIVVNATRGGDHLLGDSRMHQLQLEEADRVRVFRDMDEARRWLGLD